VRRVEQTKPRNPNKWCKSLAPWFTAECREAKQNLHAAKKCHPPTHPAIVQAAADFKKACAKGRREFAESVPEMLKYRPK
jgi:hypothetical protein